MNENNVTSEAPQTLPAQANPAETIVDALAAWAPEANPPAPNTLTTVRLDSSASMLIPFTTSSVAIKLHFLEVTGFRGYARCLEKDCPLCRLRFSSESRTLLPVYEPLSREIRVLAVSPNLRPGSLIPQLRPILERVAKGDRLLVMITKSSNTEFKVEASPLLDDDDDGRNIIATFANLFDSHQVCLSDAYTTLSAADLAAIPEITAKAKFLRVTLYCSPAKLSLAMLL